MAQERYDQDPAELVRRWYQEVWNNGNEKAIDELYAEDGVSHGLGKSRKGRDEFKRFFQAFRRNAFGGGEKQVNIRVADTVVNGDKVGYRVEADCPEEPNSNRIIRISGGGIARVENGKFVEVWNLFDFLSLKEQVGPKREAGLKQALEG